MHVSLIEMGLKVAPRMYVRVTRNYEIVLPLQLNLVIKWNERS